MPERKAWSEEEDKILKHLHDDVGLKKWSQIARKMNQEYEMPLRNGKQCRERYQNNLDSSIKRSQWTYEEQLQLYKLHDEIGNKWVNIAKHIVGRTDNCVKNHFFSKLRKSVRKLNKTIHQSFRRQFKQIRLLVINKIVQASDQKFKTFPSISNHLIYLSNRLKNMLLQYSRDGQNSFEGNLQALAEMVSEIHEFTQSYKRKPKKLRKNPHVHANSHKSVPYNFLKAPKVEREKFQDDAEENQSDDELASDQSSYEIGSPHDDGTTIPKQEKTEVAVVAEKVIKNSLNQSLQKSSDVEIILKNAGILQNRIFSGMFFLKQSESRNLEEKQKEKEKQKFNFGDSIDDLNFLREQKVDDMHESRLFENS